MRDPNQQFIFNDEELSLLKNTFAENDPLLYAVRKVFLQFPLTDAERGLLKLSLTPAVIAVLRKRILPEISDDFPLTQLPSLLTTLTNDLKVKNVEEMAPLFAAKQLEIKYLEQQFAVLSDVDGSIEEKLKLSGFAVIEEPETYSEMPNSDTRNYVRLTAYLFLLGYIDPMLVFIKSLAGEKAETLPEAKKRLERDSNK